MFLKELILTVSTLGGCGGLERTHFILQFPLWEGVVVLKELIFNSFSFGTLKELNFVGGCGGS